LVHYRRIARGAKAIIEAVRATEPPLNLVLGSDALRRTRDRFERFGAEIERWASVSLSTDFKYREYAEA